MSKILKCPVCGKETPQSGISFNEKDVKEALEASLDCNGELMYDFSRLSGVKTDNYCYWCGTDIDKIEAEWEEAERKAAEEARKAKLEAERKAAQEAAEKARLARIEAEQKAKAEAERKAAEEAERKAKREAERKAKAEAERKAREEALRRADEALKAQEAAKRKRKLYLMIGGIVGIIILGLILFFCFNSSDSDSNNAAEKYELSSGFDAESSADANVNDIATDEGHTIKVTDYSNEWTGLESRLKKLGSPLEYVNANSSKDSSKIKDDSYNTYKSIKDEAYELYKKIKDEHYQRYKKLKDAKYTEYQQIKDAAYSRYQNDEIDYSKYNDIQSEAYDKYNTIQSKAYDTYNDIQSKAYERYQALQSDAYDWQSKVRSIANGL